VNAHEVTFRQAPGWWPSLVQAVCACGWHGPVRHTNDSHQRVLLRLDRAEHTGGMDCGHCQGSGECPYPGWCSLCWHASTACQACGGTGTRGGAW
jgi:hypothetical protein